MCIRDRLYHSLGDVVTKIVAIDIQADVPQTMAERWAKAIGATLKDNVIELDDAKIRFVPASDGRGDGFAAAELLATDRGRAGEVLSICGFEFRLV